MSKPLLPAGKHQLRLIRVKKVEGKLTEVIGTFEGTGRFKGHYTVLRKLSLEPKWIESTKPFFDQLKSFDSAGELINEISKNIGEVFECLLKPGKNYQMNITKFLDFNHHDSPPVAHGGRQ